MYLFFCFEVIRTSRKCFDLKDLEIQKVRIELKIGEKLNKT